jgi:capsular polysaccharide biosynthesis protein
MLTTDTQQTVEPQIDLRTLWISIQYKLLIPIIVAIVLGVGTYKLTQIFIPKTWEASCFLIRHAKNMAAQNDMPYLYLKTDINTLLETILLRENLEKVISTMQLDISPQDLRKKIEINKTNTSNVIEIKVTWSEPALAAAIADKVSETFLQNYTQIQNSATHEIYEYYVKKKEFNSPRIAKGAAS